ncbi:MAG TPA: hypothetical protein VLX92_30910 [Kofleriaceae bacterium]|nr:hypothetical protein [Kofleriaceae bacterium]
MANLAVGDQLGELKILGAIGEHQFRAAHVTRPLRAIVTIGSAENWRDSAIRFLRASRLVEALDHPGIARVLDHGVLPDRRPWLACEVPSGMLLKDVIVRRAMPVVEVIALVRDVADVLAYAHARGAHHQALSLHAIVLATGARAFPLVVADWGMGEDDGGAFAAPEGARGDGRADIYALGTIAYRAVAGHFPQDGARDLRNAPAALASLIARMLDPDPEARPSAADVRGAALALIATIVDSPEPEDGDDVARATPRFAMPKWTPSPDVPITSEVSSTVAGEIAVKPEKPEKLPE